MKRKSGTRTLDVHGDSIKLYRRLLTYAWPYKWVFLIAVFGMIVLAATNAGFAALMKPLVDEGFVDKDPAMIRLIPPLIVGIFILRAAGNFASQYAINWVGRKVTYDLRQTMFAHLLHLPSGYFDTHSSSSLISKLIFDIEQISKAVTEAVLTLVRDGLTIVGLLVWMLYLNWRLTLLFAVMVPISSLLLRIMSRRFRKTSIQIQSSMGEISQVTQEATEGQRVVKAFSAQEYENTIFGRANERNRKQSMRKVAISAIGVSLLQIVASLALALVIYIALLAGDITAGGFVSYITATIWMMGPSKNLAKVNETIQTGLAAATSAFAVLDQESEPDTGALTLKHIEGRVEYRAVSFRYATAATDALNEVSFTINPGQTLALVGLSGSGKTTAVSLLPRFYRVTNGEILLDDVNINDLTLANLRSHIAIVGQETLLFDDTIRNNIAYGHSGAIDEDRLHEAARAAHVIEFVRTLPENLDTQVGEKGLRLSGGQRQRVAIARALYKNAPILILDEATSSLDSESERYVQDAMQRLTENRTTLVIAHRLSTVERADRIVVLSHSRIIESGTHKKLLERNGAYAKLYRKQFSET